MNVHGYVIYAIVQYMMESFDIPILFITLSPTINPSNDHSFVNLLNAQMHVFQHINVIQMSKLSYLMPHCCNQHCGRGHYE